jgi:hypothetical protein
MKSLIFKTSLILFVSVMSVVSCSAIDQRGIVGTGKVAKSTFEVSTGYRELSVSSGISVELVSSGAGTISADEAVLPYVEIVESGGTVSVSFKKGTHIRELKIPTVVTMPVSASLVNLDASAGSTISCEPTLVRDEFMVISSSGSSVEVSVEAQELNIESDSGAGCRVSGKADFCSVNASGAGEVRSYDLICREVRADASSGGVIEIHVSEELSADASGGGVIRYKGSPARVDRNVSSGGQVIAIAD